MRRMLCGIVAAICIGNVTGQNKSNDSTELRVKNLPDITIVGRNTKNDIQQLPEIVGTSIYAGKKNSLVVLENVQGNVASNNMRQILAKVPGIHIWESDPSGIQIGIAARGLSPNRSWEFNVRQNGYDIAADPFGYPEAYYNPPLQSVQRIEIVRGQGSLQYGPQFGGMINYIIRNGSEIKKKLQFETDQTVGSNGMFNNFFAAGGKSKKINFYSFYDHRSGNGWIKNSNFYTDAGFGTVTYQLSSRLSLSAELMRSHTRSRQPGGLSDAQFEQDARQSFRSRNWFDITWTIPALIANYTISETTRWNTKLFATIGDRNSVGYIASILVKDTINAATLGYNNRVLNEDKYRNYALESRIISNYYFGKTKHTISGGVRLYTGTTFRKADGKGTAGTDYDMTVAGIYNRDVKFESKNVAFFVENIFRVSTKLLLIPGIRYEWLQGAAEGRNGFLSNGDAVMLQPITRSRSFLLAGIGSEYHLTNTMELYANYSEAYRPIQFANLQAPPTSDVVDPELKDAKGYNIDLGYRGKVKGYLQFDVSGYYLLYKNRVGTITPAGAAYRLITNVGNSISKGFEGFVSFSLARAFFKDKKTEATIFATYSYTDATYSNDHKDAATKGKRVENAPQNIVRGGVSAGYSNLLITAQLSYVDKAFSDANNTVVPTANGQNGLIPAYTIADLTVSYRVSPKLNMRAGLNNLFDKRYFTRRAGGYPGPGLLPGNGRSFFVTVSTRI